jgi:hypothetical protein
MSGGRQLRRKTLADRVDEIVRRTEQVERRYDPSEGNFVFKVFADRDALGGDLPDSAIVVSVGDGKLLWPVPPDLDTAELLLAEAGISAPGASGDLEVMVENRGADPQTAGVDMLTAPITIPAGDAISWTYGSQNGSTAIDASNAFVSSGDWISFNVLSASDGAEGLVVILWFSR